MFFNTAYIRVFPITLRYNPTFGQNLVHLTTGTEGRIKSLLDIEEYEEYGKELDKATRRDGGAVSIMNEYHNWSSDGFA